MARTLNPSLVNTGANAIKRLYDTQPLTFGSQRPSNRIAQKQGRTNASHCFTCRISRVRDCALTAAAKRRALDALENLERTESLEDLLTKHEKLPRKELQHNPGDETNEVLTSSRILR